jgi:hypothetical protein
MWLVAASRSESATENCPGRFIAIETKLEWAGSRERRKYFENQPKDPLAVLGPASDPPPQQGALSRQPRPRRRIQSPRRTISRSVDQREGEAALGDRARQQLRDWGADYWGRAGKFLELARNASDPKVQNRYVTIARRYHMLAEAEEPRANQKLLSTVRCVDRTSQPNAGLSHQRRIEWHPIEGGYLGIDPDATTRRSALCFQRGISWSFPLVERPLRVRRREGCLPRYYFTVLWSNHEDIDPLGTLLADDAAALGHACRMVRRLLASGDYDDPGLVVEVRNEMRQRVLSIPFLAGCA